MKEERKAMYALIYQTIRWLAPKMDRPSPWFIIAQSEALHQHFPKSYLHLFKIGQAGCYL